jgi:hypothetical protein
LAQALLGMPTGIGNARQMAPPSILMDFTAWINHWKRSLN